MSAVFGLFNILALIYIFRGLQLIATLWRERQSIKAPPLTRRKHHFASQASFFVAVPLGVLLHELFHALVIWAFGGRVVDFGYMAIWGYVVPDRVFGATQEWIISLAGTLGSLVFGAGAWLLLRKHTAPALRFFGLRAFRFQIHFALIYYPVLTLIFLLAGLNIGDWLIIYNFGATPLASGVTLAGHAAALFMFWRADRRGWFEMPSFETAEAEDAFRRMELELAAGSYDSRRMLAYIGTLQRGQARNKAAAFLRDFMAQNTDSGPAYLQMASLQLEGKSHIPKEAVRNAEKALGLGLADGSAIAYANQLIGNYYLNMGDGQKAADHFSQAIAQLPHDPAHGSFRAQLHHWRSQAYRRQRQYEAAYQDAQVAVSLAQESGNNEGADVYLSELEIIEQHAGRALSFPRT